MCTSRLIYDDQPTLEYESINGAESDTRGATVAAIFVDDEHCPCFSAHDYRWGGPLQ
jgi:hypothetical protein